MTETIKVMIVDDDSSLIKILRKIFLLNGNFKVKCFTDPIAALNDKNLSHYDLLLVDLIMPKMDGLEFLAEVKKIYPLKPVMVLTGQGSIDTAVEAIRLGAVTYIEKPINPNDLIKKIYEMLNYKEEDNEITLKEHLMEKTDEMILVGKSPSIEVIRKNARIVSKSDSAVLITGESGTGKELVAELIYKNSNRSDKPFIKINCAALPETLFESELFGYHKGAFTGADKDKKGKIEEADKGTLFLDEIGELSLTMQTKLLRVLQQKEVERLGGNGPVKVDIRLICATNKDLKAAISEGTFRSDLYYRINVISLKIPPLRERKEDIEQLLLYYFKEYGKKMRKDIPIPTGSILDIFTSYDWPGNVRELKNTIERIFVFGKDKQPVTESDLKELLLSDNANYSQGGEKDIRTVRNDFEKAYLEDMLQTYDWNITHTAEQIGMSRRNLQKKIKALNIKKPS